MEAPTKTIVIECPHCQLPPALYWKQTLVGRTLKYLCNRYPKIKDLGIHGRECRRTTTEVTLDEAEAAKFKAVWNQIPEKWSHKKLKREQKRQECDLQLDL
jgi:hypothetical protein